MSYIMRISYGGIVLPLVHGLNIKDNNFLFLDENFSPKTTNFTLRMIIL